MKKIYVFILVLLLSYCSIYSQNQAKLKVIKQNVGTYNIVADHNFNSAYGLGFPMTYQFNLPTGMTGLVAKKKHTLNGTWEVISEKKPNDFFNDETVVRFDYLNGFAYVSAGIESSDSLLIQICDGKGNNIDAVYDGIPKYYDNRKAAVTVSADDWYDQYNKIFSELIDLFRSYGLYVTAGVTTNGVSKISWDTIQDQLNKGFFEIASHSRSHPRTPYSDVNKEVKGSLEDILDNLELPKYYKQNNKEHVYVWIAPSGDYDAEVDSLITVANYLVPRLYLNLPIKEVRDFTNGDTQLSRWNALANHFEPHYATLELGAPYWGGGDTSLTSLNNMFDSIVQRGEVYQPMWHPQELIKDIDKTYLKKHLEYISRQPNVWYVNLGPLYLYHMIQEANSKSYTIVNLNKIQQLNEPLEIKRYNSHTNPLTTIRFELAKNKFVNITIYSKTGEKVLTLANQNIEKGIYEININSEKLESGTYSCFFTAGEKLYIKDIVL